jgi:hypothetical protein
VHLSPIHFQFSASDFILNSLSHLPPPLSFAVFPHAFVSSHVGCAMSGLMADARTLVEQARMDCQNHKFTYNEVMSTESCAKSICECVCYVFCCYLFCLLPPDQPRLCNLLRCFADTRFASATRVPPCPALSELRCSLQVCVNSDN